MPSYPLRATSPIDVRSPQGTLRVGRAGSAITVDLAEALRESIANVIGALQSTQNLSDLGDKNTAIINLGLGSFSLSISRADIPKRIIPFNSFKAIGFYEDYDLGYGAAYRRGRGLMEIQDAAGTWFCLYAPNECNVGWTGARGDSSDATAAFVAARALSPCIVIPRGTFGIKNFDLGDNAIMRGASNQVATLVALEDCNYMVRVGAASSVCDLKLNGNLHASKGISMKGPYARCERIYVQFTKYVEGNSDPKVNGSFIGAGFFNEVTSTRFYLVGCATDHNRASIYGGAGINNCFIDGHDSRGNDFYGIYGKSDDESDPGVIQGLFVTGSSFIGCTRAIWFDSRVFDFTISGSTIDHTYGPALTFNAEDNSAIEIGPRNFITSIAGANCIEIAAGSASINIHDNQGISNATTCVVIRATATKRCQGVQIERNNLGPGVDYVLLLDSPGNDWGVIGNLFSPAPPSVFQILATQNFADGAELGFINVERNCFKSPIRVTNTAFRIRARNNEGLADVA